MRPANFQGNIHIINFPSSTSAAELAELFDEFGLVMGAHIKSITSTGGHLRLGIVSLAPDAVADKAIEALQGFQLGGQKLKLKRAKPGHARTHDVALLGRDVPRPGGAPAAQGDRGISRPPRAEPRDRPLSPLTLSEYPAPSGSFPCGRRAAPGNR